MFFGVFFFEEPEVLDLDTILRLEREKEKTREPAREDIIEVSA